MTSLASTKISELVCTRISHDLIGNIGSISNALELMEDDSEEIEDLKPILEESSQTLIARLKFFRLAFGLKNAAPKDIEEMKQIAEKYLKTVGGNRAGIEVKWDIWSISLYKIVYLSLMALADVVIRGGKIVAKQEAEGLFFEISSEFKLSLAKLADIEKTIKGENVTENPALMAPIVYLQNLVKEVGVNICLDYEENTAKLSIS